LYQLTRRAIKQTVVIIEAYHCYHHHTKFYLSRLCSYVDKIIGDHQCGFQSTRPTMDQILCICWILDRKQDTAALDYTVRKVQLNRWLMKLNMTHQLLEHADNDKSRR
jgi:hypothetical protein